MPGIDQPDFVIVAKKVPEGVICLTSALYFHELTVQIPRWVDVAVRQKYHPPVLSNPPVQFHWFSDAVFEIGIEKYDFGGIEVKISSMEKTVVDCFRLRRKIGVDAAVEALKNYWRQRGTDLEPLRQLATRSRVLHIMEHILSR